MGGYQSDSKPPVLEGNIPAENTLGGFGFASKAGGVYQLSLDPPLTQYKVGMQILMIADQVSTGGERINIDNNGETWLARFHQGIWSFLEYEDFFPGGLYLLVYRGFFFEVIAGLAPKTEGKIWRTVGTYSASVPNAKFPNGKAGDVLLITDGGTIDVNWSVSKDDILYCKNDNDGNNPDDWIIVPHLPPVP